MPEPKLPKYRAYVDEAGPDASGFFVVSLVLVRWEDEDEFNERILSLEKSSRRFRRKWSKSSVSMRTNYVDSIESVTQVSKLFYMTWDDHQGDVIHPTGNAIVAACQHLGEIKVKPVVDGLSKKKKVELTRALKLNNIKRHGGIPINAKDDNTPGLRLADSIAGLARHALYIQKPIWKERFDADRFRRLGP